MEGNFCEMKILLINVSGQLSSDGSRLISALLKRSGQEVTNVSLARQEPLRYQLSEIKQLDHFLKSTDLVLIAVYSSYSIRAVDLTEYIHKEYSGMPVIWGGPHCVAAPQLALRYADGVCFSEGDQAVVDLVGKMESGQNYFDTPNMAFNVNGRHLINNVLPPFADLDSLPYYDYSLENHFLLDRKLFKITKEILKHRHAGYPYYTPILYALTSRGCPNTCSYCNNSRYIKMFGRNYMRFHSVGRILDELEHVLSLLAFFKLIGFADDDFFMRPKKQLEDFATKYRRRIGLPFGVALSAKTYSREKLRVLLDCGLRLVQLGVQSASQRTLDEIYNRPIKTSTTDEVVREIAPYKKKHSLDLFLDFIIDNPYETKNDIIQTFFYIVGLPDHVNINLFFLAFFPGTPLYQRALQDGFADDFSEKTFRFYTRSRVRYQQNYETFLILLLRYIRSKPMLRAYIKRPFLRVMGTKAARVFGAAFPAKLYSLLCEKVQKAYKGDRNHKFSGASVHYTASRT